MATFCGVDPLTGEANSQGAPVDAVQAIEPNPLFVTARFWAAAGVPITATKLRPDGETASADGGAVTVKLAVMFCRVLG